MRSSARGSSGTPCRRCDDSPALRPSRRADRRGRGVHRRGRSRVACAVRADRSQPGHVRACGHRLRVPCLRDAPLPQRRDRARGPARRAARARRRAASTGIDAMRAAREALRDRPGDAPGRPRTPRRAASPTRAWPPAPASWRRRSASPGVTRASTCATRPRRCAWRSRPADEPRPEVVDRAPDRDRLRRRALGLGRVAVRGRGQPVDQRPPPDERGDGRALDRAARVPPGPGPARREDVVRPLAPPRRGPRAVERPGDRRRAAWTRPTRPGSCSRNGPGVGIGAAHDIEPWIGRAARGGRLDAPQFLEIAETLDAAARLQTSLAEDRRPLLRDLGRRVHPLPALRSTLSRSFDPVGELLDTASPRLGPLRGVGAGRLRPAPPPPRLAGRVGAGRRAPGADRHDAQRALRGARPGGCARPRSRASSTTRRAAARRCSSSRSSSWSWATRGGRRRRRSTRRSAGSSTSSARSSGRTRRCSRRRSRRSPSSTSGPRRRSWPRSMDAMRPAPAAARGGRPALRAPPGAHRAGRADRHPARRRLHGARHHGPQHRRQDGRDAHARAARADAPGRAPRPGRGGLGAAGVPRRPRRHRRRAVDRAVACRRSRATCARSSGSWSGPARARSSCSTSWAPAPTRPRAPRSPRRCSTTSSARARSSPRRPTTPRSRSTPTRRRRRATRRWSSTSRRCRPRTGSRSGSRAARRRSRSRSGWGCPTRSSMTRAAGSPRTRRRSRRPSRRSGPRRRRSPRPWTGPGPPSSARPRRCGRPRRNAGKARRERDEAVRAARAEAERLVEGLKDDVAGVRRRLERETVTAPAIDAAVARAEQTLGRLPGARRRGTGPGRRPRPRTWRLGDRARSRNGGWEGRIAALEKGGTRATLEAGGMRVSVAVEDLEEAVGGGAGSAGQADDRSVVGRRRSRARPGLRAGRRGHRQPAAHEGAQRGLVTGPARRPGRGGARGAGPLPGRRVARRPRAGADHPRPRHGRAAGCRPGAGGLRTRW